jgi:hypothetical protein
VDVFEREAGAEPEVLYFKHRYVSPEHPKVEAWRRYSRQVSAPAWTRRRSGASVLRLVLLQTHTRDAAQSRPRQARSYGTTPPPSRNSLTSSTAATITPGP